jgi:hypothetical protein
MDRINRIIRRAVRRRAAALKRGNRKVARSALRVARRWRVRRRMVNPGRTVAFDGVPVSRGLALILQDARNAGVSFRLNSGDRRRGVAERYGKKSQWQLWDCFRRGVPGCNPANPPGRSTHERRSDGVAYRGPVGRVLEWWQLGLDVDNAEALVRHLNDRGYHAKRPYSDPRERHHVNFMRNPRTNYLRRHS